MISNKILRGVLLLKLVLLFSTLIFLTANADARELAEGEIPLPDGYMIIEGDIIVPSNFYEIRAAWETEWWPDGIVPFEFSGNVTATNQTRMINAMAEWEAVANVDFRARNDEDDYVFIQNSTVNSSSVGMQGGKQIINITSWNSRFIMVHELGHALAYWHEQSRPNRDDFVQIHWNCIQSGKENNFEKHSDAGQYPRNGYDFDSVMHYGQADFLDNTVPGCTRTITVLPPNEAWQTLIGQTTHLSYLDRITMSFLYPEADWRFVDGATPMPDTFQLGMFFLPWKYFSDGAALTPEGGTLWIQPGNYPEPGIYTRAMTVRAPLGNVILGN